MSRSAYWPFSGSVGSGCAPVTLNTAPSSIGFQFTVAAVFAREVVDFHRREITVRRREVEIKVDGASGHDSALPD